MIIERLITKKSKGVGLVEILIVLAVIGIGFLAIISFLIFSRGVTFQVGRNTEAVTLAEEGIEAVRALRDEDWSNVSTAGTYYPVIDIVSDKWTLITTDPGPISNLYTRTVVVEDVGRDGNDDILSSGGTPDPNTKKVTATLSWTEATQSKQVVLTTYITNF